MAAVLALDVGGTKLGAAVVHGPHVFNFTDVYEALDRAGGARMAGGCPSGHGLSGLMQMSVSGFIAMAGFFGAGLVTARLMYSRAKAGEVSHD